MPNAAGAKTDDATSKPGVDAPKAAPSNKSDIAPPLPRFEFGADDDFQLKQAMNHLKGLPVIASTKAIAANAAVPPVTSKQ